MSTMPRRAAATSPAPSASPFSEVLAIFNQGDTLTIVLPNGNGARMFIETSASGKAARLVLEGPDGRSVLSQGAPEQVRAVKDEIAGQLSGIIKARTEAGKAPPRSKAIGLAAAAAVAVAVLGGGAYTLLGSSGDQPVPVAAAPAAGSTPAVSPQATEQLRQAIQQRAADTGFTKVDQPVPLDGSKPAQAANGQPTAEQDAKNRAGLSQAMQLANQEQQEREKAAQAKAAQEQAQATVSSLNQAGAMELLTTLKILKEKAERGEQVTPEMLKGLPPEIAKQLAESLTKAQQQAAASAPAAPQPEPAKANDTRVLTPAQVAMAGKDLYGFPMVTQFDTWTAKGGNIILPLPGGGDIKAPEDMVDFGLEP